MLCCTFAGHRELVQSGIDDAVEAALRELVELDDHICFYSGGMGAFDQLCERAVRRLQGQRGDKDIRLYRVEPYMKQNINREGRQLARLFDGVLIPEELLGGHFKGAIARRNEWLVEHCQYLIAYVRRAEGGAWATLRHARKHGLKVIDLAARMARQV